MRRPHISSLLFLIPILLLTSCTSPEIQESEAAAKNYAMQASEVSPVLTGTAIPNTSVKNVEGEEADLMSLIGDQPAVLIFYRGGWCPYCNRHLAELQQAESSLRDMGYRIFAISPDKPEFLMQSAQENDLTYTLLSDSDMSTTKAFGLAFKLDEETIQRYKENGLDLAERSGYDHYLLPAPAVYLVNPDGMITFQYVNPDYKTRIKSDVLLTAAESYHPESM